jgi:hypothetical protein
MVKALFSYIDIVSFGFELDTEMRFHFCSSRDKVRGRLRRFPTLRRFDVVAQ